MIIIYGIHPLCNNHCRWRDCVNSNREWDAVSHGLQKQFVSTQVIAAGQEPLQSMTQGLEWSNPLKQNTKAFYVYNERGLLEWKNWAGLKWIIFICEVKLKEQLLHWHHLATCFVWISVRACRGKGSEGGYPKAIRYSVSNFKTLEALLDDLLRPPVQLQCTCPLFSMGHWIGLTAQC